MGRACGGVMFVCQRMYDFQSERLNFDLEALKPKESWDKKLRRLIRIILRKIRSCKTSRSPEEMP